MNLVVRACLILSTLSHFLPSAEAAFRRAKAKPAHRASGSICPEFLRSASPEAIANVLKAGKVLSVKKSPIFREDQEMWEDRPSWILTFSRSVKGFFKSVDKRKNRQRGENNYMSPYHEFAAFLVSEVYKFEVVSATVLRSVEIDGEEKVGSVQLWVKGETPLELAARTGSRRIYESLRIWLFDLLIENTDRNGGNFIIDSDGRHWAIDHAGAFDVESRNLILFSRTHPFYKEGREKMMKLLKRAFKENPDIVVNLKAVSNEELKKQLKRILRPAQIEALIFRKDELLKLADELK